MSTSEAFAGGQYWSAELPAGTAQPNEPPLRLLLVERERGVHACVVAGTFDQYPGLQVPDHVGDWGELVDIPLIGGDPNRPDPLLVEVRDEFEDPDFADIVHRHLGRMFDGFRSHFGVEGHYMSSHKPRVLGQVIVASHARTESIPTAKGPAEFRISDQGLVTALLKAVLRRLSYREHGVPVDSHFRREPARVS